MINTLTHNDLIKLSHTYPWLFGSLLGDTYITKKGILSIGHSIKQKDCFSLKHNHLQKLGALSLKMQQDYKHYKRLDLRTNQVYEKLSFTTLSHFLYLRKYFYPSNIKIVPTNIEDYFTPESLAYWYMDDGGRSSGQGSGMVFDVSCFNEHDHLILKNMMENKFHCNISFHYRKGPSKNIKLYIKASSSLHFCNLIRPYIIPSFNYKLTK